MGQTIFEQTRMNFNVEKMRESLSLSFWLSTKPHFLYITFIEFFGCEREKMGEKRVQRPLQKLFSWVRKQSNKVKTFLGVFTVLTLLVTLKLLIHQHNHFFVLAEFAHFVGILALIYKLTTHKTCSGTNFTLQINL